MASGTATAAVLSPEPVSDKRAYASDEESIARWAAWYEGLPEDLREALDERGRSAAKHAPVR